MTERRPPLPALTVWQPWSWLIAVGAKPVENRDWPPPPQLLGGYLAIHAGKTVDEAAYRKMAAKPQRALWTGQRLPAPEEMVLGAIVAVARIAGAILVEGGEDGLSLTVRRILGQLPANRARELAGNRFAFGPWLWVLEDVVQLPQPVACRGAQKIWIVPDIEADQVRQAWAAARRPAP